MFVCVFFFFFQAEDGIRDLYVTGVQTCALPISARDQGDLEGVRPRPARAHRQPLRRMIALVTGAGNPRGIGAACVRALTDRGATVAFTVMPDEQPPADLPGTAFTTDLAESVGPEHLFDAVTERVGHPSVLVNNAAHSTRDGFEVLDAATIDAHYAVNVRAPMLLSVLLARAERPGRIVNLVSGQFLGPMIGELAYTASKGALEAFTRQLAAEVAQ